MIDPRATLEQARAAFASGDYATSLQCYENFFDHALEADTSFYGVRLSYCLDEWADLAEKFPPAKTSLENKGTAALALFGKTKHPERFHDYHAICHFLKRPEEPIEKFLYLHKSDAALAQSVFRFIRRDLVAAKEWEVCGAYLQQPEKQYRQFLQAFDGTLKFGQDKADDEAIGFAKGWFVENMADLLLVLKYTGRNAEADIVQEQMSLDLMSRGMPELADDVDDKINLSD